MGEQGDKPSIGEYLRRIRKLKGLTLTKLEELSGVSNSYLSQVENGQFKPSVEILKKLAKGLDVPYIELLQKAGYIEEAEKEGLAKSAETYRKYREKNNLSDIADLNDSKFIFDDIISAAYLNTEFLYEGEKLNREEKIFIADTLRTILRNGVPISSKERIKIINILDELLKERM